MCLKDLNLNLNHLLRSSTNISKHPPLNEITKLLVTVVEVIVITNEDSLEILDINLLLIHARILVQNIIIFTPLITFLPTMIVTNLAMANIMKILLHDHIILSAKTIVQRPLVAHINLTIVLANTLLVITTPPLDAIKHHIIFILNHVMTATAVALTLIQNNTNIIKTNPLLTLPNNPLQ